MSSSSSKPKSKNGSSNSNSNSASKSRRESSSASIYNASDDQLDELGKERLGLRKDYRKFFEKFQSDDGGIRGAYSLEDIRKEANDYFSRVKHTRELQMDADAINKIVRMLYEQSKKLKDISKQYSIDEFINALLLQYRTTDARHNVTFNWAALGQHVTSTLFDEVYSLETMTGAMQREAKVRKVSQRAKKDDSEDDRKFKSLEKAIHTQNEDGDKDESSNKRVQKVFNELKSLSHEVTLTQKASSSPESSQAVDVLKFLVDREDCVQTIENLFDFSFLLKEKHAVLGIDPATKLPTTMACSEDSMVDKNNNQLVMTVNVKKLRRINELLNKLDEIEHFSSQPTEPPNGASNGASDSSRRPKHTQENDVPAVKYPSLHRTDEIYSQIPYSQLPEEDRRRSSIGSHPVSAVAKNGSNSNSNSSAKSISKNNSSSSSSSSSAGGAGAKRKAV